MFFGQDLREGEDLALIIFGKRVFHAEGTSCAKALRQECIGCAGATARRGSLSWGW